MNASRCLVRFVFLMLLASLPVLTTAQNVSSKPTANEEKEVLKIEHEQVIAMLKGSSATADFLARIFSDHMAYTDLDGSVFTKAQILAEYRTGRRRIRSSQRKNYHAALYGNTIVLSYLANETLERKGRVSKGPAMCTDVFVKQDEVWQIVDHQATPVSW